jgi:hypothetical protein
MADGGSVKVPLAGTMSKKTLTFVLGGSAALVVFLWYRHRKNASGASSGTSAGTPADTSSAATDPNAIDPATGVPYSQEYGYTGIDPNTGLPYSQTAAGGLYDPNTGQYIYPGTGTPPPTVPTATITTNAEWAQNAETYLTANAGVDMATLSAALGKYLTARQLTAAEQSLADQAIAFAGYPPVSGPGGYPPAMHTQSTSSGGSGGGSGGGGTGGSKPPPAAKVLVPNVVRDRVEDANSALHALGLKSTFGARKPRTPYVVTAQTPRAGTQVAKGSTVHLSIAPQTTDIR